MVPSYTRLAVPSCWERARVLQDKRHVLIAATEKVQGGALFTVEQCLMPWWTYFKQPQDRCWEQAEFWK